MKTLNGVTKVVAAGLVAVGLMVAAPKAEAQRFGVGVQFGGGPYYRHVPPPVYAYGYRPYAYGYPAYRAYGYDRWHHGYWR